MKPKEKARLEFTEEELSGLTAADWREAFHTYEETINAPPVRMITPNTGTPIPSVRYR